LYKIEIGEHSFLYMDCDPSGVDLQTHGFFCPNADFTGSVQQHDMTILWSEFALDVRFGGIMGSDRVEPDAVFSDDDWSLPYNASNLCAVDPSRPCNEASIMYFLSPQVSTQSFTFTSEDIVQPPGSGWNFNNIDVTIPDGIEVSITEGLNIGGSTVTFGIDSELVYTGSAHGFDPEPGTLFRMGKNSRFTLMSPVTLSGTASEPIRFEQLSPGNRWDYLDLLADGNTIEYVELDGGDKTIEVRSTGNTFDHITSTNGYRGLSSYFQSLPGGGTASSSFDVSNSLIEGSQSVGVVAHNTDLDMIDVTIRDSGQDGLWLLGATVDTLTGSLIEDNAHLTTNSSGIAVHSGSTLDIGTDAFNTIKNNAVHEVTISSTGIAYLGTSTGGSTGGRNTIFDTSTPVSGEFYVNNTSFASVKAEYNCWNTTLAPAASLFSGSVDRDPFMSCSGLTKGIGEATASTNVNGALAGTDVNAAFVAFEENPTEANLAALYVLVAQPGEAGGAFQGYFDRVLTSVLSASDRYAAVNTRTRELAVVLSLREALRQERFADARAIFEDNLDQVVSPDLRSDAMLLGVNAYTMTRAYAEALALLPAVKAIRAPNRDTKAELMFLEEELTFRLKEEGGAEKALVAAGALEKTTADESADELPGRAALTAWPNPTRGTVRLQLDLPRAASVSIRTLDALGREVLRAAPRVYGAGGQVTSVDLSSLAAGLYLIEVVVEEDGQPPVRRTSTILRN